jgi:hypothetical protein
LRATWHLRPSLAAVWREQGPQDAATLPDAIYCEIESAMKSTNAPNFGGRIDAKQVLNEPFSAAMS